MVKINVKFVLIICLLCIGVYCAELEPWVWPTTFVYDGSQQAVEFTCGANITENEALTWYRGESKPMPVTSMSYTRKGHGTIQYIWPLGLMLQIKDKKLYCLKHDAKQNINEDPSKWSKQIRNKKLIDFREDHIKPIDEASAYGPWTTPESPLNDVKQYVEVTCWAYLYLTDTLSWYQTTNNSTNMKPMHEGNQESVKLAEVKQNTNNGYMKIMLRKKLELSDDGTEIYCIRDGTTNKDKYLERKPIKVTLKSQANNLDSPYVKPDTGVMFFDDAEELEFICGGGDPVPGTNLVWFKGLSWDDSDSPPMQSYHKSTHLNQLTLPVTAADHNRQLYCAQTLKWDQSEGTVFTKNRELARSRPVTLLHRAQCNNDENPQVTPSFFSDDGKPIIHFTCYAFLKNNEMLSWYSQGGTSQPKILLRTIQQNVVLGEWTVLDLKKTLEPSDKDSIIFCAKQRQPDGYLSEKDILNLSTNIEVKFDKPRNIQRSEPATISAEQAILNGTVFFDANTKLRFTCTGSKPVDGRNYIWLIEVPGLPLIIPEGQKYDTSTNINILEISLKKMHHRNKLFCAQGYSTKVSLVNGSFYSPFYGELDGSRSEELNLVRKDPESKTPNTGANTVGGPEVSYENTTLAVGIPLVLVTLVSVAVATWALCRRRAPQAPHAPQAPQAPRAGAAAPAPALQPAPAPRAPLDDNSNALYANLARMESPDVTYAVLDLPKKPPIAPRPKPSPEACLYAEVVGVCK